MGKRKFSAIEELQGFPTELDAMVDGNMDLSYGLEATVGEIIQNFHSYNDVIKDMANQTLITINHHLHEGCSEEEILEEFNKHFGNECKYKNIKELIEHYQTIGV